MLAPTDNKERLVIIGNGMAPGRMLEHLFDKDDAAFDVTIFNAEPRVNYNRLMLSPVLSGEKTYADIITHDDAWYSEHGVTLHKGAKVTDIDREAKTVTSDTGITAPYDRLVIATGSNPFIIPLPGHDLPGVMVYRDLDDVDQMIAESAKPEAKAVVIGGGLLGLEAAAGLKMQGMDVTVLHLMPTLMERQLDEASGHLLEQALIDRDIKIMTQASTDHIAGDGKVEKVVLKDGTELDADIVVMAVGIRPSKALAEQIGLETEHGIIVDDCLATSDPDIFALGECVQHRGQCYGLVAPLYEMARVLADTLMGEQAAYAGSVTATKLKVTGVDLYSAGDFADAEDREEIVLRDASAGIYKRLVLKNNCIIGAVMYGDTADGPWFFDLLKKATDISEMRDTLIFGQAYQGGEPLDPTAAVAALPDDAEICGCNGVCKSTIIGAIDEKALTSLDDVRAHTKASAS